MHDCPLVIGILQLPAVDYVPIHYKPIAVNGTEKFCNFSDFGMWRTDVDI